LLLEALDAALSAAVALLPRAGASLAENATRRDPRTSFRSDGCFLSRRSI